MKNILSFFLLLLVASLANAQSWVSRHNLTSAQYQTEFTSWTGKGYRLSQVSGYSDGGQDRYAAIFEKTSARHGRPNTALPARNTKRSSTTSPNRAIAPFR
jgi:hypothetical protein